MPLRPLDLLLTLELASDGDRDRTYAELAGSIGLSASEAHQAARRAVDAGLLRPGADRRSKPTANSRALLKFLEHGVRHAFFAVPGKVVRGMPTAHSAPPLNSLLQPDGELPFVWPDAEGTVRGQAIEPLYRTVPDVARRNPKLYELLALVDALRCGGARDRKLAMVELKNRIDDAGQK